MNNRVACVSLAAFVLALGSCAGTKPAQKTMSGPKATEVATAKTSAEKWIQTAETDVRSAREAKAEKAAPNEMKNADYQLQSAKAKFQKKEYYLAGEAAKAASESARQALKKAKKAKRK